MQSATAVSQVVFLGPQRLAPTVAEAVSEHAPEALEAGHVATITAGWEERELEDQELVEHLGGRVLNLELFRRAEDVFQRDPELFQAMLQRHDRMRRLQRLYRLRLAHSLAAARELLGRRPNDGLDEMLEHEIDDAVELVRLLDAQHLGRLRELHAAFDEEWRPSERDDIARHRREVLQVLGDAGALFLAGGHVVILLNRLRLFDLAPHLEALPVFAWSAGAMALTDRVIAFHDSPPQGPGDPELIEQGLGIVPRVVALPHASRRLRLDDPVRVELFARRFGPGPCVALDERTGLCWDGEAAEPFEDTRVLGENGAVVARETA